MFVFYDTLRMKLDIMRNIKIMCVCLRWFFVKKIVGLKKSKKLLCYKFIINLKKQ